MAALKCNIEQCAGTTTSEGSPQPSGQTSQTRGTSLTSAHGEQKGAFSPFKLSRCCVRTSFDGIFLLVLELLESECWVRHLSFATSASKTRSSVTSEDGKEIPVLLGRPAVEAKPKKNG